MSSELLYYDGNFRENFIQRNCDNCQIEVVNEDTLDCCIELKRQGYNPVLLNMCNSQIRGGYHKLVGGQEEDLIRRGNYLEHLNTIKYPLPKLGVIYSPNVEFIKHGIRTGYKEMDYPEKISIIACAALNSPPLLDTSLGTNTMLAPPFSTITKIKIDSIFQIAHMKNHDSIVLSAFGCGGFRNPPEHISKMFYDSLYTEKYFGSWKQYFKVVKFAIFDENYPKSNYQIFKNTFLKD